MLRGRPEQIVELATETNKVIWTNINIDIDSDAWYKTTTKKWSGHEIESSNKGFL